jgi:hypothetical protein
MFPETLAHNPEPKKYGVLLPPHLPEEIHE